MKKMLVAVAALAALVFASCTTNIAANDKLATPDVKAVATENGVIVLTWESNSEASGYVVSVKQPGYETYEQCCKGSWGYIADQGTKQVAVFPANEPDKEYSFKVYATENTAKTNLIDSDAAEVTVKTPEAWVDSTMMAASDITLTKVNGTLNKYNVYFPVKAGYKYDWKVVNATMDNAKTLYASPLTAVTSGTKDGSTVDVVYKDVEVDGETKSVLKESYVQTVTIPAPTGTKSVDNELYYVVVKAYPSNTEANQTNKFVVSSASAKYDWTDKTVAVSGNPTATEIASKKVRVSFSAAYVDNKAVDASKFTVYYTLTQNVGTALKTITETGDFVKAGTPAAYVKYNAVTTAATDSQDYYLDVPVNAYDSTKAYKYTFYVVASNDAGDSWTSGTDVTIAGNAAYKDTNNNTPTLSVVHPVSTDTKVNITITASTGATLKAYYGEFATLKAAQNATAAEVANVIPVTAVANPTVTSTSTTTTIVDGVTTSVVVDPTYGTTTYKLEGYALGVGKSETTTNTTSGTSTSTVTTTTNTGKYYVIRVVASKADCNDKIVSGVYYLQSSTTGSPAVTTYGPTGTLLNKYNE